MIAFVILHYMAQEATFKCVESLRALSGEKHIIIVDNASPNGSGARLLERFRGESGITVLLNPENEGFARGNNLGIEYAAGRLSPDFVVALNNDVIILQQDFCRQVGEIYSEQPFDVLGPDIFSNFSGLHQNPKAVEGITLEAVRAKARYVRRSLNPLVMYLGSAGKRITPLWRRQLRRVRELSGVDTSRPAENVVLHGACVVFSARWLERHPQPFFPRTWMYYEMEILDWQGRREGYTSRYDPSIQVLHDQAVATAQTTGSIIRRSQFVAEGLLQSLAAAESLMLAAGPEERAEPGKGWEHTPRQRRQ